MDAPDGFAEKVEEIARRPVQDIARTCTEMVIFFDDLDVAARTTIAGGASVDDTFDALFQLAYARGGKIVAQTLRDAIVAGLS